MKAKKKRETSAKKSGLWVALAVIVVVLLGVGFWLSNAFLSGKWPFEGRVVDREVVWYGESVSTEDVGIEDVESE